MAGTDPPHQPPATGFQTIPLNQNIEEEALPAYNAGKFNPVELGAVFKDKYKILAKLGAGRSERSNVDDRRIRSVSLGSGGIFSF